MNIFNVLLLNDPKIEKLMLLSIFYINLSGELYVL